ncbi:MAG: hypothetical protein J0M25_14480, partial [Flavobacteriales bacterium]|nr:hypothetical protein [Flavobacteriales bacterium]
MKTLVFTFLLLLISLANKGLSQPYFTENSYAVNVLIAPGTAQTFYVPITNGPGNAPIVNVEARFSYIAYNGTQ